MYGLLDYEAIGDFKAKTGKSTGHKSSIPKHSVVFFVILSPHGFSFRLRGLLLIQFFPSKVDAH
jgi:hypothetical protein